MASFNRVIIAGNWCRDPEIKYTQSGTAVCEMSLAVNDRRKNQAGEWVDEVSFVDVTIWGKTCDVVEKYTRKGSNVMVEGKLKQDSWDDRETGKKRSKLKVVCERLVMLGSKPQGDQKDQRYDRSEAQAEPAFTPQAAPDVGSQAEPDSQLPF